MIIKIRPQHLRILRPTKKRINRRMRPDESFAIVMYEPQQIRLLLLRQLFLP